MPKHRFRPGLFAVVMTSFLVLAMLAFPDSSETAQAGPDQPKLVVLVVFDQMRAEYLTRWQELFTKEGFGRLQKDGAWFQNCHYPYAFTLTAAGHASLATGCTPSKHGIIANDWYDPIKREEVSAVRGERYPLVPKLTLADGTVAGAAPTLRRQLSVGDGLPKTAKAKVVSLSIKDRAAIMMAALRAAACYWFDTIRGLFVTSTYYRDSLHPWVLEFNKQRLPDKYFGKDWNRLRDDLDYAKWSGPDDQPGEGTGYKQGTTFPHSMTGGLEKPGRAYYDAFTLSPYGSEVLLELAKRAIAAEELGQRDATDLLCLSFSSNDLVGHCWGPDSQEVLDMTLRSDLLMKDLLSHLDEHVGKGRYVLVMTADHGVAPLAEVAKAQGKEAGRVSPNQLATKAMELLQEKFAKGAEPLPWIESLGPGWVYLNHEVLKERGLAAEKVEQVLADWLRQQPGIAAAYTRKRLEEGPFKDDPIGEAVRLSYYPDCSGDVALVLKPYYMMSGPLTDKRQNAYRATHGTPYDFDTHVPLLVYGSGIQAGIHHERVAPLATAAILARSLGIPPPPAAEYPVPQGVYK
jgi:hypothetical protein